MFKIATIALFAASLASSASAYTINWQNNCGYDVWPGLGKAPNGQVDPSVAYGAHLSANGGTASYSLDDGQIGIRSWARTGCDGNGANCQTGASNGGTTPTDAGITSGVVYFEVGYQSYGNVESWDLSRVDATVNVPVTVNNGGNVKTCQDNSCPADQAFDVTDDYGAITTSPVGSTFQITYC